MVLCRPGRMADDLSSGTIPAPLPFQNQALTGNVGKMTLIGPPYADFDTGLTKNFAVREGQTLAFRAEFFNLFNHPNFRVPAGNRNPVISDASGSARADAGRIIDTVGTLRQIQFGLKYTF
jgi:hypothetical protein